MNHLYETQIHAKLKELAYLIISSDIHFESEPEAKTFFIKGLIIFIDDTILDFAEKFSTYGHRYRFHYMDRTKKLIIRWDNVPHHRKIPNFPHHKHTPGRIEPCEDTNLLKVSEQLKELIEIP